MTQFVVGGTVVEHARSHFTFAFRRNDQIYRPHDEQFVTEITHEIWDTFKETSKLDHTRWTLTTQPILSITKRQSFFDIFFDWKKNFMDEKKTESINL